MSYEKVPEDNVCISCISSIVVNKQFLGCDLDHQCKWEAFKGFKAFPPEVFFDDELDQDHDGFVALPRP